jgi:hypothetical protein
MVLLLEYREALQWFHHRDAQDVGLATGRSRVRSKGNWLQMTKMSSLGILQDRQLLVRPQDRKAAPARVGGVDLHEGDVAERISTAGGDVPAILA